MNTNELFGKAIKKARKAQGFTQEDFSSSSRTYLSTLERGLKNPTVAKADSLAKELGLHPLTLFLLMYLEATPDKDLQKLIKKVTHEINYILSASK